MSNNAKKQTLIEWLDENLPPFECYFAARKHPRGPWAGPVVVAERAGLTHRTVTRIGAKISWQGVYTEVMSSFLQACGFRICETGVIALQRQHGYRRWCRDSAQVPMKHLDRRAWKQFCKCSRRYLAAMAK